MSQTLSFSLRHVHVKCRLQNLAELVVAQIFLIVNSFGITFNLSSTPAKNHAIYQNSDTRYISDFFNFSLTKILDKKGQNLKY